MVVTGLDVVVARLAVIVARPAGIVVLVALVEAVRRLRDALAEGVGLVVVRAPLVLERRRIVAALGAAKLRRVGPRVAVGVVSVPLLLGLLGNALAEGVGLVLVGAVLLLEPHGIRAALGAALVRGALAVALVGVGRGGHDESRRGEEGDGPLRHVDITPVLLSFPHPIQRFR